LVGKYPSARCLPSPVLEVIRARNFPLTKWNATPRNPDAPTLRLVPLVCFFCCAPSFFCEMVSSPKLPAATPASPASRSPRTAGSYPAIIRAMGWSSDPSSVWGGIVTRRDVRHGLTRSSQGQSFAHSLCRQRSTRARGTSTTKVSDPLRIRRYDCISQILTLFAHTGF
jgi:hypothetical protein